MLGYILPDHPKNPSPLIADDTAGVDKDHVSDDEMTRLSPANSTDLMFPDEAKEEVATAVTNATWSKTSVVTDYENLSGTLHGSSPVSLVS